MISDYVLQQNEDEDTVFKTLLHLSLWGKLHKKKNHDFCTRVIEQHTSQRVLMIIVHNSSCRVKFHLLTKFAYVRADLYVAYDFVRIK